MPEAACDTWGKGRGEDGYARAGAGRGELAGAAFIAEEGRQTGQRKGSAAATFAERGGLSTARGRAGEAGGVRVQVGA